MIASLTGSVQKVTNDHLIVQIGGIGLKVFAPKNVLENAGSQVSLHTYLAVRENDLTLFGFDTEDDLRLFNTLLGVQKVGPKLALAILSTLSPELIRSAVIQEEAVILQRVPGIGAKSAERILFALKGKLDYAESSPTGLVSDVDADVIDVLTSLGFSIVESQAALQKVPREISDINERVAQALQSLDQQS